MAMLILGESEVGQVFKYAMNRMQALSKGYRIKAESATNVQS